MTKQWLDACAIDDIDDEDLITFDLAGNHLAIYNTPKGFFATNGMCTHEDESLGDRLVMDGVIDFPLHQGRFCVRTGKALSAPAITDLCTYETRAETRRVLVKV